MSINLDLIYELSKKEKKTLLERFAKLAEETGELAQELLIKDNASGFQHKKSTEDGILGEAIDVLLVAFSIYFKSGGQISDLQTLIEKKCEKWQRGQK